MKKSDDLINAARKKAQAFYSKLANSDAKAAKSTDQHEVKEFAAVAKANILQHRNLYIPAGIFTLAFICVWTLIPSKTQAKPAPQSLQIQQIAPQKQALEKALQKNNQLAQKLTAASKKLSPSDQYLKSINSMSMELNYLTLQNQLMKQRMDLISSINTLKKSGVKNIPALTDNGFMGGGSLLGGSSPVQVNIIYMQNGIYHATLSVNDSQVTVIRGAIVDKKYRVQRITETSVVLQDLHNHKSMNLSIQNQMRSI